MTAASIKNMYHNVQEKKKEISKQAEEYRGIVSELGTFTFKEFFFLINLYTFSKTRSSFHGRKILIKIRKH